MSATSALQLDYAPVAETRRRKRRRRIAAILFLLAIAWPIYHYSPPIARQIRLHYLQHRCLTYTAPPDQLVYDDDPADAAAIAANPSYQLLNNQDFTATSFPRVAAHTPACWNDFTSAVLPNRNPASVAAIIFCHELTSRDGVRRLVVIQRDMLGPDRHPYRYLTLGVIIIQPATLTTQPIDHTPPSTMTFTTGAFVRQTNPLRIYAGQPDPADPARFTIRYAMGNNEHMIEGRLNDGGGDVTLTYLKPIKPPTTAP